MGIVNWFKNDLEKGERVLTKTARNSSTILFKSFWRKRGIELISYQ